MSATSRVRLFTSVGVLAIAVFASIPREPPAAASYGAPSAPEPGVSFPIPLQGALSSPSTTWATVLMGKNDGNNDLFWQLFVLRAPKEKWVLATPPGVADNGGLIDAQSPAGTSLLVGFGASQGLHFSPLAFTSTAGTSWSPGGLNTPLVPVPSAVALDASGRAFALVGDSGQQVLRRTGNLTQWSTLVTKQTLSTTPGGKTCGIASLGAIATSGGATLVGATCRRPDAPGIFANSDGGWHLDDVPVPRTLINDSFGVVRLDSTSTLLSGVHDKSVDLFAAWEPAPNQQWVPSRPLRLSPQDHLIASGTGLGNTQFVLLRHGNALHVEVVSGPGTSWRQLPIPPSGTETIAYEPDGQVDALVVNQSKLGVWRLDVARHRWKKAQSIVVPIAYGTSG